jgi:hypothetical protein
MSPMFKDAFLYLLPGVMAGVPYWVMWPVQRRWLDVVLTIVGLAMSAHCLGRLGSSFCATFLGGTMMFGEWGDISSLASHGVIGVVIGSICGRRCSGAGPLYYPFSPFLIR